MEHLKPDFRWSFSKLAAFRQCPYSFYLTYVKQDREEELPNFFGLYGSFCHKLLEAWALNKLPAFCLADAYASGYGEAVTMPPPAFPKGLGEKAYNAGLQYFSAFTGFGPDWEVVSAEQKFTLRLEEYTLVGIADLVLRHRDTGDLWVIDHKTKSSSSLKKELDIYRKQLYLYALWCHEAFGAYPAKISFNLLKEARWVDEAFSPEELEKTRRWFVDTIKAIELCDAFENWTPCVKDTDTKAPYFCSQICGVSLQCDPYQVVRAAEIEAWRIKKQEEEMFYGL